MLKQPKVDLPVILAKLFLFESLSEENLALVTSLSSVKHLSGGELLFSDGQHATAFFVVLSGQLKIYKLAQDGSEQILHIQKPGDLIAEAVIFDFDNYPAYCQALEPTVVIRIPKNEFRDLLKHFPDLMLKILVAYSRRLRLLVTKIEELSLYDIKARLANFLIKNSVARNGRLCCVLSVAKKDLAALLGTIPETLSRTLNYFKKMKIITEDKEAIIILSRDRLRSFIE